MSDKIREFIREAQIAREQGLSQSDHYQDFPRALRMLQAVVNLHVSFDDKPICQECAQDWPCDTTYVLTKAMEASA